ncbi:MAG: M15 family metallopeptidase [Mesonia hippocampi]|uniref:M15 family metallopeptidase n=1 Tax=Mesonia hippocampi TaxID=1628250 RepID=UPI003F9B542F
MLRLIILFFCFFSFLKVFAQAPKGFINLDKQIPGLAIELKYATQDNFTGKIVHGYEDPLAFLSIPAASALAKVQAYVKKQGYELLIYDAYRPQQAVDYFVAWAKVKSDTIAKAEFYPAIDKSKLFKKGYIASKSGHSRGSTVDLTLINANTKQPLDMGGAYDYFGEISHHNTTSITKAQKNNRQILKQAMAKFGFRAYAKEWWHYSLIRESFPATYFNFSIARLCQ